MKQLLALTLVLCLFSLSIPGCNKNPPASNDEEVTTSTDASSNAVENDAQQNGDSSDAEAP